MSDYFIENNLISHTNQGLNLGIHVISCSLLLMRFTNLLMRAIKNSDAFSSHIKTFDKVCRKYLLYSFKENGIAGNLLNIVTDFLYQQKHRIVLMGNTLVGLKLRQEFHKVLHLDHCFF